MDNYLEGELLVKGERGYSAYEVAVQNGFVGTEQDWLATLGTSSHFNEDKEIYTSSAGQTVFDIPSEYTSNSFIDVYVNGLRLNSDEYTINTTTMKITLTNALTAGAEVEIVVLTMSTNSLPIVTTIDSESTNDTAPGTEAVYEFVNEKTSDIIDDSTLSLAKAYSSSKVNSSLNTLEASLNLSIGQKLNTDNIQVKTGNVQNIAAGATVTTDVSYPTGFTQANTVIIGKMVSSNNNYYDTANEDLTESGFPVITMIALMSDGIRIWLKNTSNQSTRTGYFKITLLKV